MIMIFFLLSGKFHLLLLKYKKVSIGYELKNCQYAAPTFKPNFIVKATR